MVVEQECLKCLKWLAAKSRRMLCAAFTESTAFKLFMQIN